MQWQKKMSAWIEKKNRNRKIESNWRQRSYSQLPNKQDVHLKNLTTWLNSFKKNGARARVNGTEDLFQYWKFLEYEKLDISSQNNRDKLKDEKHGTWDLRKRVDLGKTWCRVQQSVKSSWLPVWLADPAELPPRHRAPGRARDPARAQNPRVDAYAALPRFWRIEFRCPPVTGGSSSCCCCAKLLDRGMRK